LIVKQLDYDLTPVAGLALVGHYLNAVRPVLDRLDAALPIRAGVSTADVCRPYLGLLVQGKSDFDAIENFRGAAFFKQPLGINLLPSSPTPRQRLDARAAEMFDFCPQMIETLLTSQRPDYGVLPCGWLPLDVDTFAMDNGGTAKEGVGRTYAGVDGYCPPARLDSGKFDTNYLVCQFAALAMNILRLMGQRGLLKWAFEICSRTP